MASLSYEARDSANTKKYKPKDGDTLASICAASPDTFKSWQDLAIYNWGTSVPAEVNRVLRETIGVSAVDPADPSKTVLKVHPDAPNPDVFLAKPWTAQKLQMGKTYVLQATRPKPPNAVSLDAVDRWFIPGKEACTVSYSLEGAKDTAKRVAFEVYGSNYAAPGAWNKGLGKFPASADKKDVVLYANDEQTDAAERAAGQAIKEWKGTVTATDGALGTKNPTAAGGTEDRLVNVAFSPYTAVVRYFLDDADKKARIELAPFWVLFDAAGAPVADSLKIRWNVQDTKRFEGGKGSGQIVVVDGKGRVVFRKPLKADEMTTKAGGMQELAWTGGTYNEPGPPGGAAVQNSKGGTVAIPEDMPYRVQVQMHTVTGEAKGLALAAMHTEVRLYVAPGTLAQDVSPYAATTDKRSLRLGSSQDLLATKTLARGDGTAWIKLSLAKAGFHPGPVDGAAGHAGYKLALTEMKRSVPKRKANPGDDWARFTLDASEGDDVKDALEDVLATTDWQRPWFGDPSAGKADMDLPSATTRLNDASQEIILWVDDRHTYTDPNWLAGVAQGPTTRNKVINAAAATGNHMGPYTGGDNIVNLKAQAIPRPYVPLSADFVLLGKGDDLTTVVPLPSDADLALMRKAIGPLRVDWTFDEIDAEPTAEVPVDPTQYDKRVTRSRAFDQSVMTSQKGAAYARKDVKLQAVYHNCPAAQGGIRPASLNTYYKQPFGTAGDALLPWHPLDVSSRESTATIVHDNLGQAKDDLVIGRIGMAGVYFHPSIIGGDGYRVRAQVQFAAEGDYKLPNLDVLKARYPLLPQVQSAAIRVWKKCSVRAYVQWGDANSYAASSPVAFKLFEPGYLHFVNERGDAAVASLVTDWLADDANFKSLARESLAPGATPTSPDGRRGAAAAIKLTANRMWPWSDDAQYGLYEPSAPNATLANAVSALLTKPINPLFFTLSNIFGLALVNKIEQKKGKLRGHIILEMKVSDELYMQQYRCATCNKNYYYAEKSIHGGAMKGKACPTPACAGTLSQLGPHFIGYYTCPNGHHWHWEEGSLAGGGFVGAGCPTDSLPLTADQVPREQYKCSACAFTGWLVESGTGGDHEGEGCMVVGCAGTLQHMGGVFKENYVCDAGDSVQQFVEPAKAGGTHANQVHATCTATPKGKYQRKAPPDITETHTLVNGNKVLMDRTQPSGYPNIPVPSLGNPLGHCWNFDGGAELWGHETGHCRHMEHAGNAPGHNDAQHDPTQNTTFNWAGINETTVDGQHWDRACMMTYANQRATYNAARDKLYPCGNCALKLRGWRLAGLAAPGGAVKDP